MKISVGNDIVDVTRFRNKIWKNKNMLENIFLPSEMKNKDVKHLAGLFAAKEAVTKALDLKPGRWSDIEISHGKNGKPQVILSSELRKRVVDCSLSVAHDGKYAVATVVVLLNEKPK